jgi:hypothetical protein
MCRMCGTTAITTSLKTEVPCHTPFGWTLSGQVPRPHASLAAPDRTPHRGVLPLARYAGSRRGAPGTTAITTSLKTEVPCHTPFGWTLSGQVPRPHASLAAPDRTPHRGVLPLARYAGSRRGAPGTTAITTSLKTEVPCHTPFGWTLSGQVPRPHASLAAPDRTPHCGVLPLARYAGSRRGPPAQRRLRRA